MLALLLILRVAAAQNCDILTADLPDQRAGTTLAGMAGFGACHVCAMLPTGLPFAVPDAFDSITEWGRAEPARGGGR